MYQSGHIQATETGSVSPAVTRHHRNIMKEGLFSCESYSSQKQATVEIQQISCKKNNNLYFRELKKKERSHRWYKRQSQELEMNTGEI